MTVGRWLPWPKCRWVMEGSLHKEGTSELKPVWNEGICHAGIPSRVKSTHESPGQNGTQHIRIIKGPMGEKYFRNHDAVRECSFFTLTLWAVEGKYLLVTWIIWPKVFTVKRIGSTGLINQLPLPYTHNCRTSQNLQYSDTHIGFLKGAMIFQTLITFSNRRFLG